MDKNLHINGSSNNSSNSDSRLSDIDEMGLPEANKLIEVEAAVSKTVNSISNGVGSVTSSSSNSSSSNPSNSSSRSNGSSSSNRDGSSSSNRDGSSSSNRDGSSSSRMLVSDLYKLNKNNNLVDALSYIDPINEELRNEAKTLIQMELDSLNIANGTSSNGKIDYLVDFPLPHTPKIDNDPSVRAEFRRFEALSTSSPSSPPPPESAFGGAIDIERYNRLDPPIASKINSLGEWRKCIDKGEILLEYSSNACTNINLMIKYAKKMWLKHIADITVHKTMVEREKERLKFEIEQTNKRRKLDQVSCGNELRGLESIRDDYEARNQRIRLAISEHSKQLTSKGD